MSNDREQRIRERAHAIWEQEGRPEGRHDKHWQQASQEIGEEAGQPGGGTKSSAEPALQGLPPAVGESLEEIAKGEHQGA